MWLKLPDPTLLGWRHHFGITIRKVGNGKT